MAYSNNKGQKAYSIFQTNCKFLYRTLHAYFYR